MLSKLNKVHVISIACAVNVLSAALSVEADIIHVPADYPTIQDGINAAVHGDEVVVADGTWTGALNKNLDYGGRLITVRSENGPENCIIDCQNSGRGFYFHNGEEASSTVMGFTVTNGYTEFGGGIYNNNSSPTVSDCIFVDNTAQYGGGGIYSTASDTTIIGCTFNGNSSDIGGGIRISNAPGSPTVTNCVFTGNTSMTGGGLANEASDTIVTNCTFTDNEAYWYGGGMNNSLDSNVVVTNCTFTHNSSTTINGGGMNNDSSTLIVTYCSFTDNSAEVGSGGGMVNSNIGEGSVITNCEFSGNSAEHAGAMFNWNSSPSITNCIIITNTAVSKCGGILNYSGSSPEVTNSTFSGNLPADSGEIFSSDAWGSHCTPIITNCILWRDGANEIVDDSGSVTTVNYSNINGGWAGAGSNNMDADPLFVNSEAGDYRIAPGSPCIDAGDNTAVPGGITIDLDGNPRFVDDWDTSDTGNGDSPIIDMGAYEFQVAGSLSELTGFVVVNGTLLSGELVNLVASDDIYVQTRSGFGQTLVDLHNMEMIVSAVTTVDGSTLLRMRIESRIDEPGGLAQIRMRNWNTNDFEPVGSYAIGNTDHVDVVNNIDATNYVNGQGEIDISIKHIVFVPFLAFTFESFIDRVEIVVE